MSIHPWNSEIVASFYPFGESIESLKVISERRILSICQETSSSQDSTLIHNPSIEKNCLCSGLQSLAGVLHSVFHQLVKSLDISNNILWIYWIYWIYVSNISTIYCEILLPCILRLGYIYTAGGFPQVRIFNIPKDKMN